MGTVWVADHPLVLASRSAGRLSLLSSAGIPVEIVPSEIDERTVEMNLAADQKHPRSIASRLAQAKAMDVCGRRPGRLVLGCDQTLDLDGIILTKPRHVDEAADHLARLSGRWHMLHSAACLARDGEIVADVLSSARLKMRQLSVEQVQSYLRIAGSDVLSSVGVYQIEALGVHLFETIEGDQATIVGLPLLGILEVLRCAGCLSI
jgi:septum formation protein